ncbi:predicted protein [Thalassiosira pseudonana CCMP1335]|uniref:Peptidase S1 domain-containing protein n=1 Tax=Thalassiosira pseudonana TaxID=35128 RepID=B8CAW6_THAPS|nr:predicted protein [Thalassiosira pseudonana CCMP1335]EED89026.1 predicted protein [Thalassiosira pseudonana CCMP1335]
MLTKRITAAILISTLLSSNADDVHYRRSHHRKRNGDGGRGVIGHQPSPASTQVKGGHKALQMDSTVTAVKENKDDVSVDAIDIEEVQQVDHQSQSLNDDNIQTIIGGKEITPGSRPYLLSIGDDPYGQYCGASLITPHFALTAAHCVLSFGGVNKMYLKDTSQCVGDVYTHPEYNSYTIENDVALLYLPNGMYDIDPVQLNEDPNVPVDGSPLDLAGWGAYNITDYYSYYSNVPLSTTLNYVTNADCMSPPFIWQEGDITDSMMCAIDEDSSACYGDSGGPLVLANVNGDGPAQPVVQVGIVSWGIYGCLNATAPNVYTRISDVADWIKETVCGRSVANVGTDTRVDVATKYSMANMPPNTPWPTPVWPTYQPSMAPQVSLVSSPSTLDPQMTSGNAHCIIHVFTSILFGPSQDQGEKGANEEVASATEVAKFLS